MAHEKKNTLAEKVVGLLRLQNLKISTAESCTGGLFISSLISIPGASAVVEGGLVAYSNSAKTSLCGITDDIIEKHGSVSHIVAARLAEGAARATGADISVGITGYADGPRGGEVIFGIKLQNKVFTYIQRFIGTRNQVRNAAVKSILKKLYENLNPDQTGNKYKTGALAGKFLPPQIGHAKLIADAAACCNTLYVVLAENQSNTVELCKKAKLPYIDVDLRLGWLMEHFKNYKNIKFLRMDESTIPPYPDGTKEWSEQFKKLIGRKIDSKFFGEEAYFEMNEKFFPESTAVLIKRGVDSPEISASQIRSNPTKYLDFVIPPARAYFETILKKKE